MFRNHFPDFVFNQCSYHEFLFNMTFLLCKRRKKEAVHIVHHSKEHSKPLARPVETGCPCCLDIWPFQHKPLIFCGSFFLASLQCGRVVWITSPICEAAGFQRLCFSMPLKSPGRVLPGGLPLWPDPLFPISSAKCIKMLKAGSKLLCYYGMC